MTLFATLVLAAPEWLWPALATLAALALLSLRAVRRAGMGRGWAWTCVGLRILAVAALAACLVEPLWLAPRARDGANLLVLLADNSESLSVRDRGATRTRGEDLRERLGRDASWQASLEQTYDVRRYAFDARLRAVNDFAEMDFAGQSTALGAALTGLKRRFEGRPVAGILVFTDGNATDLAALASAADGLPPVYPVVVGGSGPGRDLSLRQVQISQTAFEDAPVTIDAEIAAAGFSGEMVRVALVDREGRRVDEQRLAGGGGPSAVRFRLKPQEAGLTFHRLEVQGGAEGGEPEATQANNRRVIVADRGRGPFRILYVAGRPNWEFKFLNRAVAEDAQLDLVALIRVAKREPKFDFLGRGGETSNPLYRGFGNQAAEDVQRYDEPVLVRLNTKDDLELRTGFPRTLEDLDGFHAVVLDDVEASFFSPDQAQALQAFVGTRGGGLLMLGGMESFADGGYARTPVGDLLPVYLDGARPEEAGAGESAGPPSVQFQLAREGWLQAWTRLLETEEQERARLDAMPAFRVLNTVRGVKPGASLLAVGRDAEGRDLPALAVQRFGRGRSAALLVGDFWRWGMRDAERQEQMGKAWRQLARWLVTDVPERVDLDVEPLPESGGAAVRLTVRVRDRKFEPVDDARVTVEIAPVTFAGDAPAGPPVTLRAEPVETEAGVFATDYVPRHNGGYRAVAVATTTEGAELGRDEAGWSAERAAEEFRSLEPNRAALEQLARRTGGEVVAADELGALARRLPERRAPIMETRAQPLWHTPAFFVFALTCLIAEWGVRRRRGLP